MIMEYLFFVELIEWLTEKGFYISSSYISLDDDCYYLHDDSDIKRLFEMFKKERL